MADCDLYEDPALYDRLVPPGPCERFYRALANRTGGPVLELACGTGRVTNALAADGHELTGLDRSAAMLRAAGRKARDLGVTPRYVCADMRSFALGRQFSLVIVTCSSLCHMRSNADVLAVFRGVRAHLAPGGWFAFDVANPRLWDLARAPRRGSRPLAAAAKVTAREEVLAYDPVQQVRWMQWTLEPGSASPGTIGPMPLRVFFPQELSGLLDAAGLRLEARHGDFDGHPLVGDSLNQVCIARAA